MALGTELYAILRHLAQSADLHPLAEDRIRQGQEKTRAVVEVAAVIRRNAQPYPVRPMRVGSSTSSASPVSPWTSSRMSFSVISER